MTLAGTLIGLAVVATAIFGVLFPSGRRLEVLLAPVAGAGVGIASLSVGALFVAQSSAGKVELLFLASTLLGALTVGAILVALWIREVAD